MPAPIALFVYKRPHHLRATIEALKGNELAAASDLFVFSDGPKDDSSAASVAEVRKYVRTIQGFKTLEIFEADSNRGLAKSIISGVTHLCGERGRVIVLEDDMVTSRWFLRYMNEGLDLYADDERVASIHGYCYPTSRALPDTFFLRGADCWGWATWARAWLHFEPDGSKLLKALRDKKLDREFDLDGSFGFTQMLRDQIAGKKDSWAVRWHASCFLRKTFTLYPGHSLVENIGNDASGTHCIQTNDYVTALSDRPIQLRRIDVHSSDLARLSFAQFLRGAGQSRLRRLIGRVMKQVGVSR